MEQYQLPEGWVWTTIGEITGVNPSMRWPDRLTADSEVSFVPMVAVDEVSGAIVGAEPRPIEQVWKGYKRFAEGDVIFARITPCMENGKAAIAKNLLNGIGLGSTEFHVLRPTQAVSAEWVYHYIRQQSFRDEAVRAMTGTAGQLRVPASYLADSNIPLPPLSEQKRIVAKIEQLFQQLDTARIALDALPPLLKKTRQRILVDAFAGRLTQRSSTDEPAAALLERTLAARRRRWEENLRAQGKDPAKARYTPPAPPDTTGLPELPEEWVWTSLDQLLERIDAGHSPQTQGRPVKPGEFGVLKVSAVSWGEFLQDENKALLPGDEPEEVLTLKAGDLLISRANTVSLVGAVVLVKQDHPYLMLSDKTLRLVPVLEDLPRPYLLYALRLEWARRVLEAKATGTSDSMRNISQSTIRTVPIPLAPLAEQQRIVNRIEALFAQVEAIETAMEVARRRVKQMKQAILGRAFRGELVAQEPAPVLPESIRAGRGAL